MNKINKLYKLEKKNVTRIILWITLTKLFVLIKNAIYYKCYNIMKKLNCCSKKQIIKLKIMMRKLKKIMKKIINTTEKSI